MTLTQQCRNMYECVTIDDKTLFVHLLVISVFVKLYDVYCRCRWMATLTLQPLYHQTEARQAHIPEKLQISRVTEKFLLLRIKPRSFNQQGNHFTDAIIPDLCTVIYYS
jgi:hypothetical protein